MNQPKNSASRRPFHPAPLLRALALLLIMLAVLVAVHYGVVWRIGMPA